jgi:SAM-dependent methyltransferase
MIHCQICPLCGSTNIHQVLQVKDYTVSGKLFPIYQCDSCNGRFTNDFPDESEIGAFYQSPEYISHTDSRKGFVSTLYQLVRSYTLVAKRKSITRVSGIRTGSVLDYGCGTGAFLAEMKKAGWQVTGLEPDAGAREKAASNYGIRPQPPQHLLELPDGSFDLITLWHVLEHVHRLPETMDHLIRVLKPGGNILLAVPNYTSADAVHYGAAWAAWDVPRHLYHFSPASMKQLLIRHQLQLRQIDPMWFDSFYVSLLSEKYRSGKASLFRAFFQGLRSNIKAFTDKETCSSLIYWGTKDLSGT